MIDKDTKSVNLIIRITPGEKEKLKKYCKDKDCTMVSLFRPIIKKIVKKR